MLLGLYTHLNYSFTSIQTILSLAFNFKKRVDDIIIHIFLHMHNINTMSDI